MAYRILVASNTDAVYTLDFDPSKPSVAALTLSSTLTVGHHPSWLERHPCEPTLVFTGLEQVDGRLLALKYDLEKGEGKVLANVPSHGRDPCSILAIDDEVIVANYSSGTVGVYSFSYSGAVELKEAQPPLHFLGTGPSAERQEASHPHQVYRVKHLEDGTKIYTEVLIPDLGADKVWRLGKNAGGKWETKGEVTFDKQPGGGPRHIIVHDSKLYTLLELTSILTVHEFPRLDQSTLSPTLLAGVSLPMPKDLPPLTMLAAELLLPPPNARFPSAFLYASNRNDPRAHGDVISIFSTLSADSAKQGLTLVGEVRTGLAHLRGFAFFGPDDRYVVAGGANGGGVKVFERTDGGRDMKEVAHLPVSGRGPGLAPTGFLCL